VHDVDVIEYRLRRIEEALDGIREDIRTQEKVVIDLGWKQRLYLFMLGLGGGGLGSAVINLLDKVK
jgi:hypothetical protein